MDCNAHGEHAAAASAQRCGNDDARTTASRTNNRAGAWPAS